MLNMTSKLFCEVYVKVVKFPYDQSMHIDIEAFKVNFNCKILGVKFVIIVGGLLATA